jgi:hypothetical protein
MKGIDHHPLYTRPLFSSSRVTVPALSKEFSRFRSRTKSIIDYAELCSTLPSQRFMTDAEVRCDEYEQPRHSGNRKPDKRSTQMHYFPKRPKIKSRTEERGHQIETFRKQLSVFGARKSNGLPLRQSATPSNWKALQQYISSVEFLLRVFLQSPSSPCMLVKGTTDASLMKEYSVRPNRSDVTPIHRVMPP